MKFLKYISCFTLLSTTACVTTKRIVEDTKSKKSYQDPSGVKTIEPETAPSKVATGAKEEELKREIDILKGQLEEREHKISQLDQELKSLKTEAEAKKNQPSPPPTAPQEEKNTPKTQAMLWNLVKSDLKAKEYEKSIPALKELSQTSKKDLSRAKAIQTLGMVYYHMGLWKEAAFEFNRMLEDHPKAPWTISAWYGQGLAFAQMGQYQEAELFFEEVLDKAPKSPEAKTIQAWKKTKNKKTAKLTKDLFSEYPNWIKSL